MRDPVAVDRSPRFPAG